MKKIGMLAGLLIFGIFVAAYSATWVGYWGGGNADLESQFPGIAEIERGHWTDLPLCWSFGGSLRGWTTEEQAVARAAISLWNEVDSFPNGDANSLHGQIFEAPSPECAGAPADIRLIWGDSTTLFRDFGDPNGDEKFTNFEGQESIHIAERMAPILPVEPCADLIASEQITRCSLLVFNVDFLDTFFVDATPSEDEEFEAFTLTHCNGETNILRPIEGGPVDGKRDLFTLIGRRFGFAIGLQDNVGCDGSIFTFGAEDDLGHIMWPDAPNGRRFP